jgi:hypothetical protein
VYSHVLTLTDATGLSATAAVLVVVYDPSAGFVTGGGWINSPAGAYKGDLNLVGKADFGFNSKYKNGATVPEGNTEFQFQTAKFNFKSKSYEWMVISGQKVRYRGVGTVNGSGNYGFELTAIDAAAGDTYTSDRFRIKIWNMNQGNGVVYDNQVDGDTTDGATPNTVIGGGNIQIHK